MLIINKNINENFFNTGLPFVTFKTISSSTLNQIFIIMILIISLLSFNGCSTETSKTQNIYNLSGIVVTDEPHGVLSGVNILNKGGTAADAVVAAFFSMSVTYPVGAGIGSGGSCIIYDEKTKSSESLDFKNTLIDEASFIGIPGSVRGLAGMQARYGDLRWSQVVLPAEKLARFGHQVSRASANSYKNYSRIAGV